MKWYNVEIPYNTREYRDRTWDFREWLINNHIEYSMCGAYDNAYIEVFASENMIPMINQALDTLVWFDSI